MSSKNVLSKSSMVEQLSKKHGFSKKVAGEVVDSFFEAMVETVANGGKVAITGYLTLESVLRGERVGVNPRTGEKAKYPAKWVTRVRLGKVLKDAASAKKGKKSK